MSKFCFEVIVGGFSTLVSGVSLVFQMLKRYLGKGAHMGYSKLWALLSYRLYSAPPVQFTGTKMGP